MWVHDGVRLFETVDALRTWEAEPFAIVGHGLTLSLFLASITGDTPLAYWPAIQLPDVAVVDIDHRTIVEPFGRWRSSSA